jgi:hypothetical protein
MSENTGNTLLQALFVAHQIIEMSSLNNSNIDIATFHNLAGRTLSGSMIMRKNKKTKINATFYSMKIVKELFSNVLSFKYKNKISKNCFEYFFINNSQNKRFYYWVNWSSSPLIIVSKFKGNKVEYFGSHLFEKVSLNSTFEYKESVIENQEITLMPYSITTLELFSN